MTGIQDSASFLPSIILGQSFVQSFVHLPNLLASPCAYPRDTAIRAIPETMEYNLLKSETMNRNFEVIE